mmetsp:Transcript_108537/g.210119  ORF Transcript_108537/g.210119 Transcript_108537/m.210119 type:complete len:114 (-) Transcript_108537:1107-1448(-)
MNKSQTILHPSRESQQGRWFLLQLSNWLTAATRSINHQEPCINHGEAKASLQPASRHKKTASSNSSSSSSRNKQAVIVTAPLWHQDFSSDAVLTCTWYSHGPLPFCARHLGWS